MDNRDVFDARSLALAVLVGMLVGCSSNPLPTTTPSPLPTGSPIDATWQVPTPSPYQGQAVNGLVTYPGDPVTFEYPAEWRMITGGFFARHYEWFEAVLGTGDWRLGCTQSVDSNGNVYAVSCGDDALTVGPGQVVVVLLTRDSPAFLRPTAPPEAVALDGSLRYTTETFGSPHNLAHLRAPQLAAA